jgi:preprotein translocase subunit SecG
MVTTWQIILAIIIVGLSIIMPIYYSYQNKKNSKKESVSLENNQIKDFVNKINDETRNKKKL